MDAVTIAACTDEFEKIALNAVQKTLASHSGTYRRHLISKMSPRLAGAREKASRKAARFSKGWKKTHGRGPAGIRHMEERDGGKMLKAKINFMRG